MLVVHACAASCSFLHGDHRLIFPCTVHAYRKPITCDAILNTEKSVWQRYSPSRANAKSFLTLRVPSRRHSTTFIQNKRQVEACPCIRTAFPRHRAKHNDEKCQMLSGALLQEKWHPRGYPGARVRAKSRRRTPRKESLSVYLPGAYLCTSEKWQLRLSMQNISKQPYQIWRKRFNSEFETILKEWPLPLEELKSSTLPKHLSASKHHICDCLSIWSVLANVLLNYIRT